MGDLLHCELTSFHVEFATLPSFRHDRLWRYAADFRTLTGKKLGVKLTRRAEGDGELELYFDPTIPTEEKIIFSRYVHEHLQAKGQNVTRFRHYICSRCGTVVGNREVAMRRLASWAEKIEVTRERTGRIKRLLAKTAMPTIICSECERRVPLWDEFERSFSNDAMKEFLRELQKQSTTVLDSESMKRVLVGEVISTVALAGHISRELSTSDHGIDMEVEFRDERGDTASKIYLVLRAGDSYLRRRERDETGPHHVYGSFKITSPSDAEYWANQPVPVLLLVRTSIGGIRWMDIGDALRKRRRTAEAKWEEILFAGAQFDVMSVLRWRDRRR